MTALWNSNAFWAYVFHVYLTRSPWERRKLIPVLLAVAGVIAIVYGSSKKSVESPNELAFTPNTNLQKPPTRSRFLGSVLALLASLWYGLFQVMYKHHVALPNDPEVSTATAAFLPDEDDDDDDSVTSLSPHNAFPPTLPFGLHPNFLLSAVGALTFILLALPFPVLDYFGIETFRLPPDYHTVLAIAGIAAMGLVFNSGFMVSFLGYTVPALKFCQILLGLWGPVITSVGGLLTIVLVLVTDVLFVEGPSILTIWNIIGSSMIISGFAVLASEFRSR